MRSTCLLTIAALTAGSSHAFVVPSITKSSAFVAREPTFLPMSDFTGWDSFRDMKQMTSLPSGEEQRKFRRTVYSHDDWKKHRSQDRFIYYLLAIFKSGVYKNLGREVWTTTAIATFVVVYNAIVGGYQDLEGTKQAALVSSQFLPQLTLPLTAFTLTSPSLGLLLGTCGKNGRVHADTFPCYISHMSSLPFSPAKYSLSYQHFIPTLGRSA